MSRSIPALVLVITLALSGCAADPVARPAGACQWTTAADVSEVVGVTVEAGRSSALETSCRYLGSPDARLTIDVLVDDDVEGYRLAERSAGDLRRNVSVGDEAFVWDRGPARVGGEAIVDETRLSVVISDEASAVTSVTLLDQRRADAVELLSILLERSRALEVQAGP